jgi:hypothetical protein
LPRPGLAHRPRGDHADDFDALAGRILERSTDRIPVEKISRRLFVDDDDTA